MVFLCAGVTWSRGATRTVINTNDSGTDWLRQAILQAMPGDTIAFQIPTYWPGYNPVTKILLPFVDLLANNGLMALINQLKPWFAVGDNSLLSCCWA